MTPIIKGFLSVFLLAALSITAQGQVYVETLPIPAFSASGAMTFNGSGEMFIGDFGTSLTIPANGTDVFKVVNDSTIALYATGFLGATGMAFSSDGYLFQANIVPNTIDKVDTNGTAVTFASSDLNQPIGVAVVDGDTLFVCNCGSGSMAKITPTGSTEIWVSSPLLQCPNGLTFDESGNMYVCNFQNGDIVKITPDKQISVLATVSGGKCGHIKYFEGNLYVVARCTHKIFKVTLDGDTSTVAGSGARGNADGPGHLASFNHPNALIVRREGDNIVLYTNDAISLAGNCVNVPLNPIIIRKITIGPLDIHETADADSSTVSISDSSIQNNGNDSAIITITPLNYLAQAPTAGVDSVTLTTNKGATITSPAIDNLDGTFSSVLVSPALTGNDTVTVNIVAGGTATELTTKPKLYYWVCGDADGNGAFQGILELNYLVNYIFRSGPPPPNSEAADVNGSGGAPNILDLNYMVNYVFRAGPAPNCL